MPRPSTDRPAQNNFYSLDYYTDFISRTTRNVSSRDLAASAFALGCVSTFVATRVHLRYFRRFRTSEWVTPDVLDKKRWVKGVVTSVGDADNFRLYHTPGLGWRWPFKFRRIPSKTKDLTGQTLHIRMAGADAPEAGHFGRTPQPYAQEALAWLKERIDGKTVYCQLVLRDQFGRLVAIPMLPPRFLPAFMTPRFGRCLSLEMLSAGWAVTYEQSGAVYGKWGKATFLEWEAKAKAEKRGQWVHGVPLESPAEYKRRYAQGAKPSWDETQLEKGTAAASNEEVSSRGGWLSRLWKGK